MTIEIPAKQLIAMKKHSIPVFRCLGVRDPADYQPHKQTWANLGAHRNFVLKDARGLMDKLEGSGIDADEIEAAFNGLMAIHDAIETERDARSQTRKRGPREHSGDPRRPNGDDGEIRGNGSFVNANSHEDGEDASCLLRPDQRMTVWAAARGDDDNELPSVGAYLRSMIVGPRNEVEKRVLSEGSDSAGGYTVPDILSARMIDRLRAQSVVFRAGAQTMPLTSDKTSIAKVVTDPSPAWRLENAAVAESDPTFGPAQLTPRSLAVMVKVSREVLEDSLNLETVLPDIIAKAMALEVDRVALMGTGAAPEPRGVRNFAGLTTGVAAIGVPTNYREYIRARTRLRTANSDVTAFVLHPRDEGLLSELVDSEGRSLEIPAAIRDIPFLTTTAVPINLGAGADESYALAGDWSRLIIGFRNQLRIEILRERFADNLQYAFLAHLRADVAAEQEKAFTFLGGLKEQA